MFSYRYDEALALAARAHRMQLRKGTDIPYIAHAVHVSTILMRYGFDEELVIAGLLHDVIEDCGLELEVIDQKFGPRVARLVDAVSERKSDNGRELPWEQRKREKMDQLRTGGYEVAALKAADAIHNAHSISHDLRRFGPVVWKRFTGSPTQTLWYYRSILDSVRHWLPGHPIASELAKAVDELAEAAGIDVQITSEAA